MDKQCSNCLCFNNHCRCSKCHPEDYYKYDDIHYPHQEPQIFHLIRLSSPDRPLTIQVDICRGIIIESRCSFCSKEIAEWKHSFILRGCHHHMHSECLIRSMLTMGLTKCGEVWCNLCVHKVTTPDQPFKGVDMFLL